VYFSWKKLKYGFTKKIQDGMFLKKYRDENILNRLGLTCQIHDPNHKTGIATYKVNQNQI
jgi:hypothetical protein